MSYLQECIMEYLRQHPEGADLKNIAAGIGSRKEVLWTSIRGLERFKLVESRPDGASKIWRAI